MSIKDVAAYGIAIIGAAPWVLICLGMVLLTFPDAIPRKAVGPKNRRKSWWATFVEVVEILLDRRRLPDVLEEIKTGQATLPL